MYPINVNYGIRFIDLVDYTNPNVTFNDVINKVNELLTLNCKDDFYITDDVLWNDFIKRFTRRFCFRTLSYDTYLNFCIKLNDIFTSNKVKLNNMYNAKLIEFNPLYTKKITTENNVKKDRNGTSEYNKDEHSENNKHDNGTSNSNTNYVKTDNNNSTSVSSGGSNNYDLHSDSPRSSVNVDDLFKTDNNYITDAKNNNSNYENNDNVTQKNISDNKGSEDNTYINDTNENKNINENSLTVDNIKDTIVGKELLYGYEGNPTDLLRKYINFVIDTNEYLLDQIENSNLFMNIIV